LACAARVFLGVALAVPLGLFEGIVNCGRILGIATLKHVAENPFHPALEELTGLIFAALPEWICY